MHRKGPPPAGLFVCRVPRGRCARTSNAVCVFRPWLGWKRSRKHRGSRGANPPRSPFCKGGRQAVERVRAVWRLARHGPCLSPPLWKRGAGGDLLAVAHAPRDKANPPRSPFCKGRRQAVERVRAVRRLARHGPCLSPPLFGKEKPGEICSRWRMRRAARQIPLGPPFAKGEDKRWSASALSGDVRATGLACLPSLEKRGGGDLLPAWQVPPPAVTHAPEFPPRARPHRTPRAAQSEARSAPRARSTCSTSWQAPMVW